jgi:hypothetical protein
LPDAFALVEQGGGDPPMSSLICWRLSWAHAADLRRLVKSASLSVTPERRRTGVRFTDGTIPTNCEEFRFPLKSGHKDADKRLRTVA